MRLRSPFTVVLLGVLVMTTGVTFETTAQVGIVTLLLGFMMTVSGLMMGVKETFSQRSHNQPDSRDDPSMIRIVGVLIALISLATPYVRRPLAPPEASGASFVDVATAILSDATVEGGFILMLLMAVVVAGAFIAIFHHVGGYIMLLGSMTFVFMAIQMIGSIEGLQGGMHFGLYLSIFAAFVIISSSLIRPTTGLASDSDWTTTGD